MSAVPDPSETLAGFVLGRLHWRELLALGIEIDFDASAVKVSTPAGVPVYEPTIAQVATGMVVGQDRGEEGLREWAAVLLGTDISLDRLDEDSDGDLLLNALWDLAGLIKVERVTWEAIYNLSGRKIEPGQDRILAMCVRSLDEILDDPTADLGPVFSRLLRLISEFEKGQSDLDGTLRDHWRNTKGIYAAALGASGAPPSLSPGEVAELLSRARTFRSAIEHERAGGSEA